MSTDQSISRLALGLALMLVPFVISLMHGHAQAQAACEGVPLSCPLVLSDPVGVTVGPGGAIYIADAGTNQIVKLSREGPVLARWGGQGTAPGRFDLPASIAAGAHGIYVADVRNHRIQQFSPSGQVLRTWKTPVFPTWWYTDANWSPFLVRVATGADGSVFMFNGTMWLSRYTPSGRLEWQRRIALRRSDVGPGGYPQPYASLALAVGREGTIDLSLEARGPDNKGGAPEYLYLQQRDRRGAIHQEWTALAQAFSEGRPLVATGMAVTSKGTFWVTHGGEHGLVELSRRDVPLRRVGAEGCGPGRFEEPSGVAVDGQDRVYVVDLGMRTLQELSPTGQPLAFWGSCGAVRSNGG